MSDVGLTSTPIDPSDTEDINERWAKQIEARPSLVTLKRKGTSTVVKMSVPQFRVAPITATSWHIRAGATKTSFQLSQCEDVGSNFPGIDTNRTLIATPVTGSTTTGDTDTFAQQCPMDQL